MHMLRSPRVIVDDDLSLGRERVPIVAVNEIDDAPVRTREFIGRSIDKTHWLTQ